MAKVLWSDFTQVQIPSLAGLDSNRDGGRHASTSGRDYHDQPLGHSGSSRSHIISLLNANSIAEHHRSDAIVSLIPSGTEILFALGLSNR